MHSSQKTRWVVDAALFTSFLLAFFLDLTGLSLHQWIGLSAAAVAAYHLIAHDAWVDSTASRFFGKLAARSRLYFLIDAALLAGFATITITGLVISSWFNLQLASYDAWRFVHIAASIVTLLVTVAKLALHWRWIVTVTRNIFTGQKALPQRPVIGPALLGRREFGRLMGVIGISSLIALASSLHNLRTEGNAESTAADVNSASINQNSAKAAASASGSTTSSSAASTTCAVRCRRRCAYPGHCRKYVDSNSSGRCDLGECA
jgi:hypothetical protein